MSASFPVPSLWGLIIVALSFVFKSVLLFLLRCSSVFLLFVVDGVSGLRGILVRLCVGAICLIYGNGWSLLFV